MTIHLFKGKYRLWGDVCARKVAAGDIRHFCAYGGLENARIPSQHRALLVWMSLRYYHNRPGYSRCLTKLQHWISQGKNSTSHVRYILVAIWGGAAKAGPALISSFKNLTKKNAETECWTLSRLI